MLAIFDGFDVWTDILIVGREELKARKEILSASKMRLWGRRWYLKNENGSVRRHWTRIYKDLVEGGIYRGSWMDLLGHWRLMGLSFERRRRQSP